jgi:hypothetical protein
VAASTGIARAHQEGVALHHHAWTAPPPRVAGADNAGYLGP